MNEGHFEGVGGLRIFTRTWNPPGDARAVLVVVHGFNSHSGYYHWFAEKIAESGIAVHALDLRGRGRSDGERYFVEKFSDYVTDVGTLIQVAKAQHPGRPVFLLGHSAGGVISCSYALDNQVELAGLICESFAFQVPAPDFALAVLKGLSHFAPHAHVLKLKKQDFSRDPQVTRALLDDPLLADELQPTLTVAEMVRADERLERDFPLLTLPVLIIHGTADKVTKPSGSQFFFDTVGSKDKTLKMYQGYWHDPLNDVGKEAVLADIQRWLDARIPLSAAVRERSSTNPASGAGESVQRS